MGPEIYIEDDIIIGFLWENAVKSCSSEAVSGRNASTNVVERDKIFRMVDTQGRAPCESFVQTRHGMDVRNNATERGRSSSLQGQVFAGRFDRI